MSLSSVTLRAFWRVASPYICVEEAFRYTYKIHRQSGQIANSEEEIKSIKVSENRVNEKHILKQVGKLYKEKANEGRRWKEPSDWNGVWRNGRTGPWALRMRGV